MSAFLLIYPELREAIFITLLTSPDPLPPPVINRENRIQLNIQGETEPFESCNHYPSTPPKITSTALLLCNRQIHTELSATIAHLKLAKKLRYELDCEIVSEQTLYPTWLLIPVYLTRIPCIYVTFRLSGRCTGKSAWRHGCGGPGRMIWSLMALLNRFLKRGPDFLAPATTSNHPEVERLVLDIITPVLNPGESFQPPDSALHWMLGGSEEGEFVHPERVLNIMQHYLGDLFNGWRDTIGYGKFIASGVGSIHLKSDGQERFTWDLTCIECLH